MKILMEYDFDFVDGKEPPNTVIHEFGFWHPSNKMKVRRRRDSLFIFWHPPIETAQHPRSSNRRGREVQGWLHDQSPRSNNGDWSRIFLWYELDFLG